ncbi:MAG: phosphoserine phosphatase SerB [Pseudomonadota bacterium]
MWRLVLTRADSIERDAIAAGEKWIRDQGFEAAPYRRLAPSAVMIPFSGGSALPARDGVVSSVHGMDANIVSDAAPGRLLIADMDSTMISVECIDELADFVGKKDEVSAITEQAMRGELDFEGALIARVALLRGLPEEDLAACYAQRVTLNPGARVLVQTMRAQGAVTALVSGGFTYFSARVAEAAGFDSHQANTLLFADGRLTGEVGLPILGRAAKLSQLELLCTQHEIAVSDVIAVGDGANDLAMIEAAGLGVAYHAKPALKAEAQAVLDRSDLTAILAFQGIGAEDWRH